MTKYEVLANLVAIAHILIIVLVFVGIFVSIRVKRYRPIEALILLGAVVIWSIYGACPLTSLEDNLRKTAGYPLPLMEIGFIPYYFSEWFHFYVSSQVVTWITYILAGMFLVLSIEWELPLFKKLQNRLAHKRYRTHRK